MESESENGGTIKCEAEVKPSLSMEKSEHIRTDDTKTVSTKKANIP